MRLLRNDKGRTNAYIEYKCKICGENFKQKSSIKKHVLSEHEDIFIERVSKEIYRDDIGGWVKR